MGKLKVCARDTNLCLKRGGLLCLDRAVNANENLTLAHPFTRIDIYLKHASAFANDTNGNFAACGERARCVNGAHNRIATRGNHGNGLRLTRLVGVRRCRRAAAKEIISGARNGQNCDNNQRDVPPTPIAFCVIHHHIATQRTAQSCFVIHTDVPNSVAGAR